MGDMTAAEALEEVIRISMIAEPGVTAKDLAGANVAYLRALGFAVVPVEANEETIERGMDEIANTAADCGMKLLCKIERRQCGCRQAAEDAYAAMVAPDAEKGRL